MSHRENIKEMIMDYMLMYEMDYLSFEFNASKEYLGPDAPFLVGDFDKFEDGY